MRDKRTTLTSSTYLHPLISTPLTKSKRRKPLTQAQELHDRKPAQPEHGRLIKRLAVVALRRLRGRRQPVRGPHVRHVHLLRVEVPRGAVVPDVREPPRKVGEEDEGVAGEPERVVQRLEGREVVVVGLRGGAALVQY